MIASSLFGLSAKDESLRYIKQLKVRSGAFEYNSDNVLVADIVKDGGFLHFQTKGTACEREHLMERTDNDRAADKERAIELQRQGKTQRQIAAELNISASSVNRLLKSVSEVSTGNDETQKTSETSSHPGRG